MRMKPLAIALFFCFPLIMLAQQEDVEDLILVDIEDQIQTYEEETDGTELNSTKLLQLGHHNTATSEQNNDGSFNLPNIVTAFQHGVENEVFILQAGSGNRSTSVQYGYANEYELELEGNENTTRVFQFGVNNEIEQYITADGVDYTVIQQGISNELIQIENNPEMPNYTIWQRGRGISVRIENVSIY